MNQEKQKVYRAAFRASAVKLATEPDQLMAQTAKDPGINVNTLHTWISKYSQPKTSDKAVRTDERLYDELKRLKKEVARRTEERDLSLAKYAWIKQHTKDFSVEAMCRFLKVSHSAYHARLQRGQTEAEKDDAALTSLIRTEFDKSRAAYGTRRLKHILLGHQRTVSRRRINRLMREANLACKSKRKFKATTNSRHDLPIAPNHLDRQFTVNQPNQTYVGDITYVHTQEGWLYPAVVIDLFSRQVAGWSMAEHMRTKAGE
jgi:transposase-like protein